MKSILILIMLLVGNSIGFLLSRTTLYQKDLAKTRTDYAGDLIPLTSNEMIDSIKFEPENNESTWDYIPQVLIVVDTVQVVCGNKAICRIPDRDMHAGKIYRDSVFNLRVREIDFIVMGDCVFDCALPTEQRNDCPALGMPNEALYTGVLKIFSNVKVNEFRLIGHSFRCGASFENPLDPVNILPMKRNKKIAKPARYNAQGKMLGGKFIGHEANTFNMRSREDEKNR